MVSTTEQQRQSAITSSANAINMARPVRSGRPRSLPMPHKTFTYSLGGDQTVADVLAHLIPAEIPAPAMDEEPTVVADSDEVAGPRGSPLTPVASPQILFVEEDATAGAEASPVKQTLPQQPPVIGHKRKADHFVPITPPRRVRKKSDHVIPTSSSNQEAPAPEVLANLSRNVKHFTPVNWPDYEHEPLAYGMSLGLFSGSFKLDASDKDKAEDIVNNILDVASRLLKRQRVLVHDYDTFDSQTYKPMGHVDEGTKALRHFTSTVRTGLEDMEKCIGELADL